MTGTKADQERVEGQAPVFTTELWATSRHGLSGANTVMDAGSIRAGLLDFPTDTNIRLHTSCVPGFPVRHDRSRRERLRVAIGPLPVRHAGCTDSHVNRRRESAPAPMARGAASSERCKASEPAIDRIRRRPRDTAQWGRSSASRGGSRIRGGDTEACDEALQHEGLTCRTAGVDHDAQHVPPVDCDSSRPPCFGVSRTSPPAPMASARNTAPPVAARELTQARLRRMHPRMNQRWAVTVFEGGTSDA